MQIEKLNPFKKPQANSVANGKVEEYNLLQLQHQESAAYHEKMAEYYREGIERLKPFAIQTN